MKTILKITLALLITVISPYNNDVQAQSSSGGEVVKKKVVVYVTGEDVQQNQKNYISSTLLNYFVSSGKYRVMERSREFLAALDKEVDISTSGEIRDDQIVTLGRKYGVVNVVVANVSELYDEMNIDARIINIETGEVINSSSAHSQVESLSQLEKLSKNVAQGLLNQTGANSNGTGVSSNGMGRINGHEYVDLGLPSGLKWATCNVGAYSPSDCGSYFAWGETYTKNDYTENNSRTYGRTFGDIGGNAEYDAARANWGGSWRLPTKAEFEELINNCTWSFITMGNHNGYKVTGPNGNYIFLPAAGCRYGSSLYYAGSRGYYWSSTPNDSRDSYELDFSSGSRIVGNDFRDYGQSVRPVSE